MQTRIKHINKYEEKVNSFVQGTFSEEKILKKYLQLKSLDKKKLPLASMLLGVKDIINVNGYPTKCGSDLPYELFDGSQASCVSKLLDAGAIFAGKTVTAEFAVSDPGKTKNPRNLNHTPGGSSSGSGASVAASFCDIAIGTQTCGSVIRPAGYCGVFGYKPSFDGFPTGGVRHSKPSIDTPGFFTRCLEDVALMRAASLNTPINSLELKNKDELRVGRCKTEFWSEALPETASMIAEVSEILSSKYAKVEEVDLGSDNGDNLGSDYANDWEDIVPRWNKEKSFPKLPCKLLGLFFCSYTRNN